MEVKLGHGLVQKVQNKNSRYELEDDHRFEWWVKLSKNEVYSWHGISEYS